MSNKDFAGFLYLHTFFLYEEKITSFTNFTFVIILSFFSFIFISMPPFDYPWVFLNKIIQMPQNHAGLTALLCGIYPILSF